jgi:hypothetical protein
MDATENSSIEARLDKYNETSTVVMNAFAADQGISITSAAGNASAGHSNSQTGTWLYRPGAAPLAVPEPSTFSMLAFCGIAMAGYSRLRRRRK